MIWALKDEIKRRWYLDCAEEEKSKDTKDAHLQEMRQREDIAEH